MLTCIHPTNDVAEADDLLLLATLEGISFEERDYPVELVTTTTNDEHVRVVTVRAAVILPDRSTVKLLSDEIKDLFPASILADTKLGH